MAGTRHQIRRADIMPMEDYARVRAERRRAIAVLKRHRRLAVGPDATFYFENYDTMWHQVHEMLYVERGGEAQIADELTAYNPLVPDGRELVATLMIEIEDAERRARVLAALGGIEDAVGLCIDDDCVRAVAETDVERTDASGKTSAVHFLRFLLDAGLIKALRRPGARVVVAIDHANYGHMAVMPEATRLALCGDLD